MGRREYKTYLTRLLRLLGSYPFLFLTFVGNSFIVIVSILIYYLEREQEVLGSIVTFSDALWWSFATVTTVGYGDIAIYSEMGRILGVVSMLVGTGFFACYTALFANALLGREIDLLGIRAGEIRRDMAAMQRNVDMEDEELHRMAAHMESLDKRLGRIEASLDQKSNS